MQCCISGSGKIRIQLTLLDPDSESGSALYTIPYGLFWFLTKTFYKLFNLFNRLKQERDMVVHNYFDLGEAL